MFKVANLTDFSQKVQFFAARSPAYYYAYGQWRLKRWLYKSRSFSMTDAAFWEAFDWSRSDLAEVKSALSRSDAEQAVTKLMGYFQIRISPVFFFQKPDEPQLLALIDNDQKVTTIRAADKVCQNTFDFRQVGPVRFEEQIDWGYCPEGNIDWTWDLNRHAYFETLGRAYWYTGDERYAHKFRQLLLGWLIKNPPATTQRNWYSVFEVGFRINVWIWAFFFFRNTSVFDPQTCLALLKGLLSHGRYLDANIELHVPNNHLLLEAKALALLGILFPEFKEAKRWQQRGLNLLYREIRAQVQPDGVHGEQSTHYHRIIASELLELLVLLDNNQLSIPSDILNTFSRMVEFDLWITKPNGSIPLLSDAALVDTYLRFNVASGGIAFLERDDLKAMAPPLDEATIWLLGPARVEKYADKLQPPTNVPSRAFPTGGYFVMRAGTGTEAVYLTFDCGPFGYKHLPNHGHADALSFELYAYGQTLLVDPGIYSTSLGQNWRNFFRGTHAHNTVVVDEQDQSLLLDTRRVHRPAQAALHQWHTTEQFDFVDGSHNGYERLTAPVIHRRQILFVKPEYWVVVDLLQGVGQHCFDLYFHLAPQAIPELDPLSKVVRAVCPTQSGLIIAPLTANDWQAEIITGATAPIQGWVSFYSGEKQAAPTLRYRQIRTAPTQFCTVLYPYQAGRNVAVSVLPLQLDINEGPVDGFDVTSLQIESDQFIDLVMIDRRSSNPVKTFTGYETDAQLIFLRHQKESQHLLKAVVRGGHQLLFQDRSLDESVFASIIHRTS